MGTQIYTITYRVPRPEEKIAANSTRTDDYKTITVMTEGGVSRALALAEPRAAELWPNGKLDGFNVEDRTEVIIDKE